MLRILSLLLLSLVLLTTACSKDNPEPEPTLEGTWQQQAHIIHYYDESGKLLKDFTSNDFIKRDAPYIVITDKTLEFHTNTYSSPSIPYTREGSRLHYDAVDQEYITVTITELTSQKLTLHFVGPYRPATSGVYPGHDEWDDHYTR